MTANLNLMTEHLSPILPHTRTASRASAISFEPLLKALWRPSCILGDLDTAAKWKSRRPNFVEPPGPTGKISHPSCSLQVKSRPNCLGRSENPSRHRTARETTSPMTRHEHFRRPSRSPLDSFRGLPLLSITAL